MDNRISLKSHPIKPKPVPVCSINQNIFLLATINPDDFGLNNSYVLHYQNSICVANGAQSMSNYDNIFSL